LNLTEPEFAAWLNAYGKAWETGDTQAAKELFAPDASYHETPFDEPMRGLGAIEKYWREGAELAQADVEFEYEIITTIGPVGWCHWRASFVRVPSGIEVALDGIIEAGFVEPQLCVTFREWWHRREGEPKS